MWSNISKIVDVAQTFLDKLDNDLSDGAEEDEGRAAERARRLQEPYVESDAQTAALPPPPQQVAAPSSPLNDSWAFDSPPPKNHKRAHSVSVAQPGATKGKQSRQQETADVKSSELHLIKSELQEKESECLKLRIEIAGLRKGFASSTSDYELRLQRADDDLQRSAVSSAELQVAYDSLRSRFEELVSQAPAAVDHSTELRLLTSDNEITKAELARALKHSQDLVAANEKLLAELTSLSAAVKAKESNIAALQDDLQAASKSGSGKKGKKGGNSNGSTAESEAKLRQVEAELQRQKVLIDVRESDCSRMRAEVDAKEGENSLLSASAAQLLAQLQQAETRAQELESQLAAASAPASGSKGSSAQADIEAIQLKMTNVKSMRDSLKADVGQTLAAFSSELKGAVDTLSLSASQKVELDRLRAECDSLHAQLAEAALEASIKEAQAGQQHEASVAAERGRETVIDALRQEKASLINQLRDHSEALVAARRDCDTKLSAAAGRVGELEALVTEARKRVEDAETRETAAARALESVRRKLEDELGAAAKKSQDLEDKLQQQVLDNTGLRRTQSSAEAAAVKAREAAAASEAEARAAGEDLSAVKDELRSVSSKLDASKKLVEKKLQEIDGLQSELKAQEASISQLRASIQQSSIHSDSLADSQRALRDRASECATLRDEVLALTVRASKAEEEVQRFSEKKKRDLDNLKKLNEQINLTQREKGDIERKHREMLLQMERNEQRADRAEALYEEQRSAIVRLEGKVADALAELSQASHMRMQQVTSGVEESPAKSDRRGAESIQLNRALLQSQDEVATLQEQISNLKNESVSASRQADIAETAKLAAMEELRATRESCRQQVDASLRRVRDLEEERVRLEGEVDGLERLQLQQPFNALAAVTQREVRTLFPPDAAQQDVESGYETFTPDKSKKYDAIALPSFLIQIRYQLMGLLPRQYLDRVPPASKIALYYVMFLHLVVLWSRVSCQ